MISVIVPVYNIAPYIDRCVKSILEQTYSGLELILVDDGSKDGSGDKCDEWAKKDNRVSVIHKPNGGVSSARNAGLDVARGEYISFIDGDDWLEPLMFEKMIQGLEDNDCDAAFCGFKFVDETGKTVDSVLPTLKGVVRAKDALDNIVTLENTANYQIAAWNKVFKAEIIGGLRFNTNLVYGEDGLFSISTVLKCNKLYLEPKAFYNYLLREGSATHTVGLTRQRIDNVRAWNVIKDVVADDENLKTVAEVMMCRIGMPILVEAYIAGENELVEEMQGILASSKYVWFKSRYTSKGTRAKYKLLNMLVETKGSRALADRMYKAKR